MNTFRVCGENIKQSVPENNPPTNLHVHVTRSFLKVDSIQFLRIKHS